jgi:pyruvate formate lyase activating enzyme
MLLGGFLKQSFSDYPGKIASVVFTKGCNFYCKYCHNPDLVRLSGDTINSDSVLEWIYSNQSLLGGVVISGGEPTIQKDLYSFVSEIKSYGLSVKLDTNGTNPNVVESLITDKLIDYIAMDIKAPLELSRYRDIVGETFSNSSLDSIRKTIDIIEQNDIDYEFRTTLLKPFHSAGDIINIADDIHGNYYIQKFDDTITLQDIDNACVVDIQDIKKVVNGCSNKSCNIMVREGY